MAVLTTVLLVGACDVAADPTASPPMQPPAQQKATLELANRAIERARATGLIVARPEPRRVNVNERLWDRMTAFDQRALVLEIRYSAYNGQAGTLDDAVVYGWQSGQRRAQATSVGVTFE